MTADLIILAAIAVFVLLRLRSVLGHKIGHDQPPGQPNEFDREGSEHVVQLKPRDAAAEEVAEEILRKATEQKHEALPEGVRDGVKDIVERDSTFDMEEFMEGAKAAFAMVVEAYSENDTETLRNLLSKELYASFKEDIDEQRAEGRNVHSTLVSIEAAEPVTVELTRKHFAQITVAFETEQIRLVRDLNGEVIEGNPSQIDVVSDEWIFERDMRSTNPNWKIVST